MSEKTRYTDEELEEFKAIIEEKLEKARSDYEMLRANVMNSDEEASRQALRLGQYIQKLQNALLRIKNKTYGIDRITGKLIPKERLRVVPHATLSVESKQ